MFLTHVLPCNLPDDSPDHILSVQVIVDLLHPQEEVVNGEIKEAIKILVGETTVFDSITVEMLKYVVNTVEEWVLSIFDKVKIMLFERV